MPGIAQNFDFWDFTNRNIEGMWIWKNVFGTSYRSYIRCTPVCDDVGGIYGYCNMLETLYGDDIEEKESMKE